MDWFFKQAEPTVDNTDANLKNTPSSLVGPLNENSIVTVGVCGKRGNFQIAGFIYLARV
jgi:hypothetical protein